jgi:predicted methyltransferase
MKRSRVIPRSDSILTVLSAVLVLAGIVAVTIPASSTAFAESQTRPATAPARLDRSILDDPGRPDDDKKQDAGRKALDVYEWVGMRPGMTVADLFCAGGYNTHLLSKVVGGSGKVYAVFEFYANKELFDGQLYKVDAMKERVEKGGLSNVELAMALSDLPSGGVDAMITVRNYHDVEWVFESLKREEVVQAIYRALKPGGVIGIVDVATPKDGWDQETHRLNEKVVIEDFRKGGFELAGRSDMLANADDDHTGNGFKEGRHKLDRYVLKFRKPGGSM